MPILSESNQQQLREVLENDILDEVRILLYTKKESPIVIPGRECATCRQTGELLQEVSSLSEKLQLEIHDFYSEQDEARAMNIYRIPAVILEGKARGKLRFFGIPAGLGFPSFIDGLIDVSKGSTSLSEETRSALGALQKDVHIQVFTTPT